MSDETDPVFARAAQVDDAGKAKFGNGWQTRIAAIGRVGVDANAMRGIVVQPDAVERLDVAGREALLQIMANGDAATAREAEREYNAIRDADRDHHRKMKGRS